MNKTQAKKYLVAINNCKKRNVTCEVLSNKLGIYPEIIAESLSFFEPMLLMDSSFNLKELIPEIEKYIEEQNQANPKKQKVVVRKKDVIKYKSIGDFVYKKMTLGGLVDKNATLDETDLRTLKKLVEEALSKKKIK